MQVATAQEALFMACEMESSAIQLYTRALSLMEQLGRQDEPLYDHLTLMLADEQEPVSYTHLDGPGYIPSPGAQSPQRDSCRAAFHSWD